LRQAGQSTSSSGADSGAGAAFYGSGAGRGGDWRFSEHAAPAAQAVYAVCVELMALPCAAADIGASLVDVFVQWAAFSHKYVYTGVSL